MAKRSKIKKILIIAISVMLGISAITALFTLSLKTKRVNPAYHIGNIDIETGKHVKSDDAIYSDLFECQGLKIEPNFSKNVNYSVFFYRFDESFVSARTNQSDVFKLRDNDVIKYARILIIPDRGEKTEEAFKVSVLDIPKITKDIKVTVSKNQEKLKNLAELEQKGSWDDLYDTTWQRLKPISTVGIKELAIVFESGVDNVFDDVIYKTGGNGSTGTSKALSAENFNSKTFILDVENKGNVYISVKPGVKLAIYKYN